MSSPTPAPHADIASQTRRRGFGIWSAVVVLLIVGLLIGAALWMRPGSDASVAEASIAPTSDQTEARVRSFEITTVASGELEARNQIEIRSTLEQRSTITLIVPEGQRVERGDVLVRLNTDTIESEIEEELLRVESANNELAAAETAYSIQISTNASALRNAELNVELKQLALDQWKDGDVKKRRQQLKLAIEQAERQLDRLKEKFERSEELLSKGFLSKNERDIDEINYIEAVASLDSARLDQEIYDRYQYPRDERSRLSDVEEAEANLQRVIEENEINLKNREANLLAKRRQLELREQKLAKYRTQLEAATIRAPAAGLVVYASSLDRGRRWGGDDGPLQIGRQVNTNELLIVLPDTSEMIAAVRVHESLAGRVRPGQPADVKIDAAGGAIFAGTVESIGVLAETGGWRDPNRREYTVRVAINAVNDGGRLKPSMRCEATIQLGRVDDALSVPLQAVFSDGAVRYVYVPVGSKFERVPVRVGRRSAAYAEILSGLNPGDRVLLREPERGEVLAKPFDNDQLAMVGMRRDPQTGQVVPILAPDRGRPDRPAATASVNAKSTPDADGVETASVNTEIAETEATEAEAAETRATETKATETNIAETKVAKSSTDVEATADPSEHPAGE